MIRNFLSNLENESMKEDLESFYLWPETPINHLQTEIKSKQGYSDYEVDKTNSRPSIIINKITRMIEDKKIPDNFSILDICCGDGIVLQQIKKSFPKAKVFGTDILKDKIPEHKDIQEDGVELYLILLQKLVESKPDFKFDIVMMLNTYRGWDTSSVEDGTQDLVDEWLGKYSKNTILTVIPYRKLHADGVRTKIENQVLQLKDKGFNIQKIGKGENDSIMVIVDTKSKEEKFEKITFVIPTRNNLEYLKLAYESIRNLDNIHEILVLDDASEDGTGDWLNSLEDDNLVIHTNPGPDRVGIVGMFDKGIEMATTDIIFAFHADMIVYKNLDMNILKHLDRGKVICATRVEPPLHPKGPEKIIHNFGLEPEEFNFDKWYSSDLTISEKTTNGIFAPWCMYKEDFLKIGGHDELFAPQSREDSDLFNRFLLNGYELIQSWDALVYHFTSRGSRYNKFAGGDTGKDSPEWQKTNSKNMRNFIRKWGTMVKHDDLMLPIVPPKYDIGFVVKNCNEQLLGALEPWCSTIYVDTFAEDYINQEQPNTALDLTKRIYSIDSEKQNDIEVRFDGSRFTNESFRLLQQLPEILANDEEFEEGSFGSFELDIFEIIINNLQTYEGELIKCKY